jgi:hypothetical protein
MARVDFEAEVVYRGDHYEVEWTAECDIYSGCGNSFNAALVSLQDQMADSIEKKNRPKAKRKAGA